MKDTLEKLDKVIEHIWHYLEKQHGSGCYEPARVLGELLERRARIQRMAQETMLKEMSNG